MTLDGETLARVRAAQTRVRQFGLDLIASVGNASPTPGTVRVGPVPCGDDRRSYRVEGVWQVPLPPERHLATLRAVRGSWLATGLEVVSYHESDNPKARLVGEDPVSGMTFSITSTVPPHAVKIQVTTACAEVPQGELPAHRLTVYE